MALPLFQALAGEAHLLINDLPRARIAIEEGLAVALRNEEGLYQAELYRLRGEIACREITDSQSAAALAEQDYARAIEIAQTQHAKSWELRATLSLARLWITQGRAQAARERLARVYAWFTEGFDTPDLKEAAALLADLAR